MNKDKSTTIAFSGHRNNRITTDRHTLTQEIEKLITAYYFRGYRCFMTGMAKGFDLLSAEAVLKLRQTYTDIKLIAVIPFTGQAKYFSDEDKKRYGVIFQQCDESVLITDRYYTGCFHRRNDYLIDHASLLVCYFDGTPKGGTFYTVNRAKNMNMPVINLINNQKENEWWENETNETKSLFSGIDPEKESDYHYRIFWQKLDQSDRNNVYQYWQYRKGWVRLSDDDANSLQMEVICELADTALENESGKFREDMCDNDGSFYEEYQDRFNDLYDEIEDKLFNNHF